ATVLPELRDIKPETFLPSSRSVAFLKTAWARVNGYPEWLDYCEDLIFDFAIRAQCGGFSFAPNALVYFRPRGSLRSFYKQYYLYARGDGKANLWLKRHLIRYATYLIGFPALVLGALLITPWLWFCLFVAGFLYVKTPLRRLVAMPQWPSLSLAERLKALAFVPIIRVVGDIAKMIGYPAGLAWRMVNG
ncbi:MAG: glycosyl transferase, partial [Anaerolineae bacterium]|nr:glycosyl transferase [Anaerolineae bacterium]